MTTIKLKKTLDPGTYHATIASIEETETKFGPAFKFIYITDDDQEASELVNKTYTKKTKFGKRVKEILRDMPDEVNLNRLVGAKVTIELEENDDSDFCKIVSVKRQPQPVQPVQQPEQPVQQPEPVVDAGVSSEAPF